MTIDPHWRRLEALFDAALDVPEPDRHAWLAEACPSDAGLRAEVERMLDAHRRAGGVLDRPPSVATPQDLAGHVSRALDDRYDVERQIGSGGAALVFLARERKHDRRVVLKVLKPDVAVGWGTERFVREVRIAAQLAHPNIVCLIDSGDADGLLYYVMPYVEGETLRSRLARHGSLDAMEAVGFLRDIASALAHAHESGVVHRDLKPENILCSDGHAFLMDFGVAKMLDPRDAAEHVTQHGVAVGTPAYMAPEQREGRIALDERADVYAWGLLAHEMLTGRLPARSASATPAVIADRLAAAGPELPSPLLDLVGRCLAPDPRERPAHASQVAAEMSSIATPSGPVWPAGTAAVPASAGGRRLTTKRRARLAGVGIVLVGVAVALGTLASRSREAPATATAALPSPIVVAALANETGDPSLDSWGRMAGDWITQGLQETGTVGVISWPTARLASERVGAERAAGRVVDPVAIIQSETGAQTIVTGSYYLVGDSLQFTVEVSDARGRRLVGALPPVAAPRDSAHAAIRLLRDRLMTAVTVLADARFGGDPDLVRRPPTFAAYQLFDRALSRFLAQDYEGSVAEFREAYAQDTSFVLPLLYAASALWNYEQYAGADSLVRYLLGRRGELNAYHLGWAEYMSASYAGDGERALAAIRRAADQAPGSRAWYTLASLSLDMGRPDEALAALDRLDPDRGDMRGWSSYWTQLTYALHLLGRHERELAAARELRARFPDRRVGHVLEARALAALGRTAELDSLFAASLALPPTTYWSQGAAMVVAGEELVAHHDTATGRAVLRRGAQWLREQLAVNPKERGHRYWLGSAAYDLERWAEAERVFAGLARDFPERMQDDGMRALATARLGRPDADRLLPAPEPRQRGEHTAYRARLAAIAGDRSRAASLFADAVRLGVDDLPWLHASAYNDIILIGDERGLAPTLRVERRTGR